MSVLNRILLPERSRERYPLELDAGKEEINEASLRAEEVSRNYRPSLVYDTSPAVLKVRRPEANTKLLREKNLGVPETRATGFQLGQINGPHEVILQERADKPNPDREMFRDAVRYADSALEEGFVISAGVDDFGYRNGELLYLDATDRDSFTPLEKCRTGAVEGMYNGLKVSSAAETGMTLEEAEELLSDESAYFKP